jgi:hypothetical protein
VAEYILEQCIGKRNLTKKRAPCFFTKKTRKKGIYIAHHVYKWLGCIVQLFCTTHRKKGVINKENIEKAHVSCLYARSLGNSSIIMLGAHVCELCTAAAPIIFICGLECVCEILYIVPSFMQTISLSLGVWVCVCLSLSLLRSFSLSPRSYT